MSISLKFLSKPASLLSLATALGVSAMTGQVQASVAPTNLDTAFSGETLSPVAGFLMKTVDLYNSSDQETGTLGNCVFEITSGAQTGDYVYEEKLTTGSLMSGQFSGMTTEFAPAGFTGEAGWSYSNVINVNSGATATASDFTITLESPSGQLHWASDLPGLAWTTGTSLTFFYVSTDSPGSGVYNVEDGGVGEATSYAPAVAVPVPAAASMGLVALAGLAGFGLLRRRMAAV